MSELESAQPPPTSVPVPSSQERARIAREALIGKSIAGRYVLRALLGHGGMGAVYEAEHLGIGKKVAIKFVDPEFVTDEQVVTRFAREARAMSAIESAHIVSIFDAGTEEGRPYLVMELLRGEDLGQRLRRTTRVPLAEALHIIAMVLKGLGKAHAAGIVHRDLKPDNVFLVKNDDGGIHAKIVDFGVSKIERPRSKTSPLALTGRGTVLGTPFYMSPEQAQAMPDLDGRADLYSAGTILFECLTGRPPFTGETYEQIILAICMRDAPDVRTIDPEIPPPVAALVAKALARDRTQRFSSADEMLAALHELSPEEKKLVPREHLPNKTLAVGSAAAAPASASQPASTPFQGNATQIAGSGAAGAGTAGAGASGSGVGTAGAGASGSGVGTAGTVGLGASGSGVGTAGTVGLGASGASALGVGVSGAGALGAGVSGAGASGAGAAPSAIARSGTSPLAVSTSDRAPAGMSRRRSTSAVIATAVVATLLGIGATLLLVSAIGKKDPPASATAPASITSGVASSALAPSPSPIPSPPEPASTAASASPSASSSAAPSAPSPSALSPSPSPLAAPLKPAVPPKPVVAPALAPAPAVRPSPGPAAPAPVSAPAPGKLDIARDLP
ncbi:MAG: serine/threonine protein kinase [Labilithrix sp.]|nr:serine/threonine protein kinase [Labilithrix sp.]MCW5809488.1 serine/threonine protein kinase [Labilithrix sp.]